MRKKIERLKTSSMPPSTAPDSGAVFAGTPFVTHAVRPQTRRGGQSPSADPRPSAPSPAGERAADDSAAPPRCRRSSGPFAHQIQPALMCRPRDQVRPLN